MKIKSIYLALFSAVLLLTSCSETKGEPGLFDNWELRNVAFIDSLSNVFDAGSDPSLFAIRGSKGNYNGDNLHVVDRHMEIYYKKYGNFYTDENSTWDKKYADAINQKNKDRFPIQGDKVTVYYRGLLVTVESQISKLRIPGFLTSSYKDFIVFDGNFGNNTQQMPIRDNPMPEFDGKPLENNLEGFVPGFTQVLQFMKPGDRIEVYIPSRYGYGKNASGAIPGHSNLVFDLTLVDIL